MATKLYPPQIDGILPAFYKNYTEDGEVKNAAIAIPFGMNRAVTLEEVYKLSLRLKTVSTNTIIYVGECDSFDRTELIAYFTIDKETAKKLNEGQFYKGQVAFINRNEIDETKVIGYYSTVGTIKCVAKPKVTIGGYDPLQINTFIQEFIGEYQQNTNFGDSTEKVETYEFNLWDNTNQLILSSGELLHNSADDISSSSSTDVFKIFHEINQGELYYIQYTVTTLNNLHISSPLYKVMQGTSVDIQYPLKLYGTNNYEEGYIELRLDGELNDQGIEKICTGTFLITRGSEIDDYFEWDEIIKFNMEGKLPSSYSFRDFTVAQGIKYKYRIQQYNQYDLYSNPVYMTYSWKDYKNEICEQSQIGQEKEILADFEDMFIYDGKRQLKVKYNPKVSSFKNTIPEQKIETIGSKYPFIFRSGHVNYKEFPISGLISFNMDSAMLFLTEQELLEAKLLEPTYVRHSSGYEKLQELTQKEQDTIPNSLLGHESYWNAQAHKNADNETYYTVWPAETLQVLNKEKKVWQSGSEYVYNDWLDLSVRTDKNLTTENLMGERYFKLKVLDWLTDGQVKLFRSPGEGNYLVRILNVSLSPQDQLGRMLHTFTGTCYEMDELNYSNLIHYGIVTENLFTLMEMHWGSVYINEYLANKITPWADFIDEEKNPQTIDNWNGYYLLPLESETVIGFECTDFAPGDKLWITYTGADDDEIVIIGETGAYSYMFDDRTIEKIAFMPNPEFGPLVDFSRVINYCYEGIQNRKFDTVKNIFGHTELSKQYVGPYDDVFEQYKLYTGEGLEKRAIYDVKEDQDYSQEEEFLSIKEQIKRHPNIILSDNAGGYTAKFDTIQVEILHAYRRPLIPVFAIGQFELQDDEVIIPVKFALTPFGNGYVNYNSVYGPYYYLINKEDAQADDVLIYQKNGDTYQIVNPDAETGEYPSDIDLYICEDQIRAISSDVMNRILTENKYYINQYDLENINFALDDELGTPFSNFEIYQVFVPVGTGDQVNWQALDYYYDVYYKTWRRTYEPTFSINATNSNEGIVHVETVETNAPLPNYLVSKFDKNKIERVIALEQGINNFVTTFTQDLSDTDIIDMSDIDDIIFTRLGKIDKLEIGNGVMVELTFQLQIIDYAIEDDNNIVRGNKAIYLELKENYNKKLADYFSISSDTGQEELEQMIADLEDQILAIAENVDTNYIAVDGTLDVDNNIDSNGVPIINGSNDSNYAKIISSTTEAKEEAIEPKPLKQQLIISGTKCFNDMLKGWVDEERKLHYGLLQLHPFDFSNSISDIRTNLGKINKTTSSNRNKYFDFFVRSNINEYSLGRPLTTSETLNGNQIVTNIDWWPYRAVPFDYIITNPYKAGLLYGNKQQEDGTVVIIEPDNSYQLFDLHDPFFKNTMAALLFRINDVKNKDKLLFYNTNTCPIITPETEGYNSNRYYTYETEVLEKIDNQNITDIVSDFTSLQDFVDKIQNQINIINILNSGLPDGEILQTRDDMVYHLDNIKNNYIDLLYLLVHSPYISTNNILNPFLTKNGVENAFQNSVEVDYANNRESLETILLTLKPCDIAVDLEQELAKYITVKYIKYINAGNFENVLVYYIMINNNYIPVFPIKENNINKVFFNDNTYQVYKNNSNNTWYIQNVQLLDGSTINRLDLYVYRPIYSGEYLNGISDTEISYSLEHGISTNTVIETSIQEQLKEKFILKDSQNFFANKVGRFVEAHDDLNIQINELIMNWVIPYYKSKIITHLKDDEAKTVPSGYENQSVRDYIEALNQQITTLSNSINVWDLVFEETGKLIRETDPEDYDKIEDLKELYNTAKYNKQIKEQEKAEVQQILNTFMLSDIYKYWAKLQNEYQIFNNAIFPEYDTSYRNALAAYYNNEKIYLELFTLLVDLLVGSDENKKEELTFNIAPDNFYSNAISVTNKILEYTNRTQYASIYSNYKVDLLNTNNDTIIIKLDYFALKDLMAELAPPSDQQGIIDNNNFNIDEYAELLEIYKTAIVDLNNRYKLMETEMEEITSIYQGRASFIESLDAIIEKYQDLLEKGKTELRKLLNRLKKLKTDLIIIDISNAPSTEEVENIWNALTKYLLCLEKYYIQEVERRYEL